MQWTAISPFNNINHILTSLSKPNSPPKPSSPTKMAPLFTKYKAAAVNAEPGWLDLELSVEKTIHWINEAGKNGCKLIAFPELCKAAS